MKQIHKHNTTSCLLFLIFLAFPCEIEQIVAHSDQNNHYCSHKVRKMTKVPGLLLAPPVHHPYTGNCRSCGCLLYSTETIVQTSLHVTQAYRLQRSPVSRDVINYTYIDRNDIHYSCASQRQSYFPPFQHDEKILNNRPPLQTSAFQWSWLTLKRLKLELLSYQGTAALAQHVSNCWWPCGFQGLCFCFVFVWRDKPATFKLFKWRYSVHLEGKAL